MISLLRDEAVLVAVAIAIGLIGSSFALSARTNATLPAIVVWLVAAGGALPLARFAALRYRPDQVSGYGLWSIALLVVAVVLVSASIVRAGNEPSTSVDLTIAVAAAACGVFLFIPETDLLRVATAPLVVIGGAVLLDWLRPFGRAALALVLVTLVWLSVVDGAAQPRTMLATAAVLSLVSMSSAVPSLVRRSWPGRFDRLHPSVLRLATGFAIMMAGRVLGTSVSSLSAALCVAIVALGGVVGVGLQNPRPLASL